MFCTQCGNEIDLNTKYCDNCGIAVLKKNISVRPSVEKILQMPNFGNLHTKWWGRVPETEPFSEPYEWLNKKNTLLVFEKHLALVPGAEKRNKLADASSSGQLVLVGGAFSVVRTIKDKISNKLEDTSSEWARNLFDTGELIWCQKIRC